MLGSAAVSGVEDLDELRARLEAEGLRIVDRAEHDAQMRELTWLRAHSAQQAEGIAWLRTELAIARSNVFTRSRDRMRDAVARARRKSRPGYVKLYSRLVAVGVRVRVKDCVQPVDALADRLRAEVRCCVD